jgi:hypothetical protein
MLIRHRALQVRQDLCSALLAVRREYPVIPRQMHSRRRRQCSQARQQIQWTMARISLSERDMAKARAYASSALANARLMARPGGHSADVGEALLLLAESNALAGKHDAARRRALEAASQLEVALGTEHSLTRRAKALSTSP